MLENGKIELFLREEVTTMMEGLRAGKIGLHQLQKTDAKKKYGEELIETIPEAYRRQQTVQGKSSEPFLLSRSI